MESSDFENVPKKYMHSPVMANLLQSLQLTND